MAKEKSVTPAIAGLVLFGVLIALTLVGLIYYGWLTTPGKPFAMMG